MAEGWPLPRLPALPAINRVQLMMLRLATALAMPVHFCVCFTNRRRVDCSRLMTTFDTRFMNS